MDSYDDAFLFFQYLIVTMRGEFRRRLEDYKGSLIIGVAGDSGSGKSTFTKSIRNLLSKDMVSFFSLDDYHTEDRETRKQTGHLPLDPEINNLTLAKEHIRKLRRGEAVIKPVYNHNTGKFDPPAIFEPKKIIIIEGLHALYDELRDYMDLRIYVDPSRNVKKMWKLKRDVKERGYRAEDVLYEMRKREPYFKRYIDFQKVYADIVIKINNSRLYMDNAYLVETIYRTLDFPLSGIDMNLDLSTMLNHSKRAFMMNYRNDFYYMKDVSRISFDGLISRDSITSIENRIMTYTGFTENYLIGEDNYINAIQLSQILVSWYFVELMTNIFREIYGDH